MKTKNEEKRERNERMDGWMALYGGNVQGG